MGRWGGGGGGEGGGSRSEDSEVTSVLIHTLGRASFRSNQCFWCFQILQSIYSLI